MSQYMPTTVADHVRSTGKAPRYGHPAHTEVASGYGPCRHCLQTFRIGAENRVLFTYDPFEEIEQIPLPGPVFIHADTCERYPEDGNYPAGMLPHAAVLNAYAKGQHLVARVLVEADGGHEAAIAVLLGRNDVDYIEVRDRKAGCFDFRVEPKT